MFWIKSFVWKVICKTFLPVCSLCFHSFNSVFCSANFLIFKKSNLSIFPSMYFAFGVLSHRHKYFLFSSKSCTVGCFIVTRDQFWVNFHIRGKVSVEVNCFAQSCQLFHHHLLKRLSFLYWVAFELLSKIIWPYFCGFNFWTLFCSFDLCVYTFTSTLLMTVTS